MGEERYLWRVVVQGSITALTVTTYNLFSLGSTVDLARPRTNVHFFLHFFYFFLSRLPLGDHETPFSAPSNQLFLVHVEADDYT